MKGSLVFLNIENTEESNLVCPVCKFEYQHPGKPMVVDGQENYAAGWWGRGSLTILPFESECGTKWELCFGFHKGNVFSFTRIIELCCKSREEEDHG